MTSVIEVFNKDSIRLNVLKEVLDGLISLKLQINNEVSQDYRSQIHNDRSRVYVFGKYNISEDPSGEFITIRPVMIEGTLRADIAFSGSISKKRLSVVRSSTKAVEAEYEISSEMSFFELIANGKQSYKLTIDGESTGSNVADRKSNENVQPNMTSRSAPPPVQNMGKEDERGRNDTSVVGSFDFDTGSGIEQDERFASFDMQGNSPAGVVDDRFESFGIDENTVVSTTNQKNTESVTELLHDSVVDEPEQELKKTSANDSDLNRIEKEISVIEQKQGELSQKKQSAIEHLEKIEAEYQKDYESIEQEVEEIKLRMEADESIIEHYKDQDITPIEVILQQINLKLEEAEQQIKIFIEAKQKKTMEIENEIKSNKR